MEGLQRIVLSRQIALKRELESVANNIANVNTPGFKSRFLRFGEMLPKQDAAQGDRAGPLSFALDRGSTIDFSDGAIEKTGSPLDVAVQGNSLFAVQTPQGERYTRDGSFRLDAQGRVVTGSGFPVLGDGGPITLAPGETNLSLADDGRVITSAGEKGRLRLVDAGDPRNLVPEGDNLFSSRATLAPAPYGTRILPGHREKSNVQPVMEVARLIEVSRAYADVAGLMQRHDELKRTGVEKLATVPNGV